MKKFRLLATACTLLLAGNALGATLPNDSLMQLSGTVRTKYEWQTSVGEQRFQVRNARVALQGFVLPIVGYKVEIDLSNEGRITMLDAYTRFIPSASTTLSLGQMRVPFTIDAHRAPHKQYLANRSFIAKQVGNVRDVGLSMTWKNDYLIPLTWQGGLFNGSGIVQQKEWHNTLNFSTKLECVPFANQHVALSVQKLHPSHFDIFLYDVGTYYDNGGWHAEVEYLYKTYAKHSFPDVHAFNAFAGYRFRMPKGYVKALTPLVRYDRMGDHSTGEADKEGKLFITDYARQRVTAGMTLHFDLPMVADLRLNYEKYFYKDNTLAKPSEKDKLVVELMVHF